MPEEQERIKISAKDFVKDFVSEVTTGKDINGFDTDPEDLKAKIDLFHAIDGKLKGKGGSKAFVEEFKRIRPKSAANYDFADIANPTTAPPGAGKPASSGPMGMIAARDPMTLVKKAVEHPIKAVTTPLLEGARNMAEKAGGFAGEMAYRFARPGGLMNVAPGQDKAMSFSRGFGKGAADLGVDMTSALNLGMMLTGAGEAKAAVKATTKIGAAAMKLKPIIQAAITGGFTVGMLDGLRKEFPEVAAAYEAGDMEKFGQSLARTLGTTVGVVAGGASTVSRAKAAGGKTPKIVERFKEWNKLEKDNPVEPAKPALKTKASAAKPASTSAQTDATKSPGPLEKIYGKVGADKPLVAPVREGGVAVTAPPLKPAAPPTATTPPPGAQPVAATAPAPTAAPTEAPLPTDVPLDQWFNGLSRTEENLSHFKPRAPRPAAEAAEAFSGTGETTAASNAQNSPVPKPKPKPEPKAPKASTAETRTAEKAAITKTLEMLEQDPSSLTRRSPTLRPSPLLESVQTILGTKTKYKDPAVVKDALSRRLKMIEAEESRQAAKKKPESGKVFTAPKPKPTDPPPTASATKPVASATSPVAPAAKPAVVEVPKPVAAKATEPPPGAPPAAAPAMDAGKTEWIKDQAGSVASAIGTGGKPRAITLKDASGKTIFSEWFNPAEDGNIGEWLKSKAKRLGEAVTLESNSEERIRAGKPPEVMSTFSEKFYADKESAKAGAKKKTEPVVATEPPRVTEAKTRLKARVKDFLLSEKGEFSTDWSTKDLVQDFKDLRDVGQHMMLEAGKDFRQWSKKMVDTVGDWIQKDLPELWKSVQPAPEFYNRMDRTIESKMPKSATVKQVQDLINNPQNASADEVQWSGIKEWLAEKKGNVTKKEVQDFLRDNSLQVSVKDVGQRFSEYQMPGPKSNYKVMLFTLPEKIGSRPFVNTEHHSEPNVVAWARINERVTPEGKKALFVEEVQSDWHQTGRKEGYTGKPDPELQARVDKALEELNAAKKNLVEWESKHVRAKRMAAMIEGGNIRDYWTAEQRDAKIDAFNRYSKAERDLRYARGAISDKVNPSAVPDAPFKKDWPELVMKRMLRHAAENGYDEVSWTRGAHQIDRYQTDLRQNVGEIRWRDARLTMEDVGYKQAPSSQPKEVEIYVAPKDGSAGRTMRVPIEGRSEPKEFGDNRSLDEIVGGSMANQIRQSISAGERGGQFKGEDLAIGGEGMKSHYDKRLVDFMNRYTKKWGSKVGEGAINTGGQAVPKFDIPIDLLKREINELIGKYKTSGNNGNVDLTHNPFSFKEMPTVKLGKAITVLEDIKSNYHSGNFLDAYTAVREKYSAPGTPKRFLETLDAIFPLEKEGRAKSEKVHTVPVTPEMKKAVVFEGQPLSKVSVPTEAPPGSYDA
jgi:hypothetical protein